MRKKSLSTIVKEVILEEQKREGFMGFDLSYDGLETNRLQMTFFYLPKGETQVQNQRYEYTNGERTK